MNKTILQYFEWYLPDDAQHWKRAAKDAKHLADMGVTDVWLPPAYKGADGIHDVGYGVYDTYDLGEFDQKGSVPTKYGTKDEYLSAVKAFHKAGIGVLADIVLDHRIGADHTEWVEAETVNPENRDEITSDEQEIKAYTLFDFPGRGGKYSQFVWNATCFKGVDFDASTDDNKIYKFIGKKWSRNVDKETGNFDYLMGADIDFQAPYVTEELYRWGEWYLDTVGMDGFRLDAVKHITSRFFEGWLTNLREKSGKELFTVGEYWNAELPILLEYLDNVHNSMSLFDVGLHFNFFNAANAGGNFDMAHLLDNSLVQARPENAVTFVDNHDTQPGQALESFVPAWFKPLAYAVILLREGGVPCVFYGDSAGIPHNDIPPMGEPLEILMKLRQTHAYGPQHDYFDDYNIVGWTREGSEDGPGLAAILSDGAGGEKYMYVGKQHAGETWVPQLPTEDAAANEPVVIDEEGGATFHVPGGAVQVYTKDS